jgi:ribosomal protein S18 acetylase RimI-like enzyme
MSRHLHATDRDLEHLLKHKELLAKHISPAELRLLETGEVKNETVEFVLNGESIAQVDSDERTLFVRLLRGDVDLLLREIFRLAFRRREARVLVLDTTHKHELVQKHHFFVDQEGQLTRPVQLKCFEMNPTQFRKTVRIAENDGCACDCECTQLARVRYAFENKMQVIGIAVGDRMAGFAVVENTEDTVVWAFYIFPCYRMLGVANFFVSWACKRGTNKLRFVVCCDCCTFFVRQGFTRVDMVKVDDRKAEGLAVGNSFAYERFVRRPLLSVVSLTRDKAEKFFKPMGEFIMMCIHASNIEVRRHDTAAAFTMWMAEQKEISVDFVVHEKKPVAFCVWLIRKGEVSDRGYSSSVVEERVYVAELFVHPGWQGMGIGEYLLCRLPKRKIQLHVENDNYKAIRFYERLKFRQTTTKHRHVEMIADSLPSPPFRLPPGDADFSFLNTP